MKVIRKARLEGDGISLILSNVENESADYQAYLIDLVGFYGGVAVSGDSTQRKLSHGLFATPSLRTGREMTLNGTMTFATEQLRSIADRFVSGVLWSGNYGTLTVETDDLVLTSTVKLGGEIKHEYIGTEGMSFEVPLSAPDPFLYAPARTYQIAPPQFGTGLRYPLFTTAKNASGTSVLDYGDPTAYSGAFGNAGNATAYPRFIVRGSWPAGFRITAAGRSIEYPSPITAGSPVEVVNAEGAIMVNGYDDSYKLTQRDWFSIPPGDSIQPRIEALAPSNGWADVIVSDTYI